MQARRVFGLIAFVVAGCSAQVEDPSSATDEAVVDGERSRHACECAADHVCEATTRKCIARPTPNAGDLFGEIALLRQDRLGDRSVLANLGEASTSFNDWQPMPADHRQSFRTSDGETCFFELDTMYPSSYDGGVWPSGPGRGAGKQTFDVSGRSDVVELDAQEIGNTGWGYFHQNTPPALGDDHSKYPDLFDAKVVPFGASFRVRGEGGPNVSAYDVRGDVPQAFEIVAPKLDQPNATVSKTNGIDIQWSPPQPSAFMEVFITVSMKNDYALVSCKVKDDGATVVPAEALSLFKGQIGIQLRRTTERYVRLTTPDGHPVHVSVLGRNARVGEATVTE